MKLLGVDYGRAKIGLAISEAGFASPFLVVRVSSSGDVLGKIEEVVKQEQIDKVITGVSEGEMGKEQEKFADLLRSNINIPVETFDEGLTTQDAQLMAREAGLKQKKRREMEDAYAATIMLQSYIDSGNK